MTETAANPTPERRARVRLVAVDMGYGHMRAACALADELGVPAEEADRPPLCSQEEVARWRRMRRSYEAISRASQLRAIGFPLRWLLSEITAIPPPYELPDQREATLGVRLLERMIRGGLGQDLVARLQSEDETLVTTFYAPAIAASLGRRSKIVCVVTDSDINRIWAPRDAGGSPIVYCTPSERAARRLRAFGVPPGQVHVTGFPLPPALLGGAGHETLRRNLAERLVRLDPKGVFRSEAHAEIEHFLGPLPTSADGAPARLTFAVGGAGAQVELVRAFLPSLKPAIAKGKLRVTLVAGLRPEVGARFSNWILEAGLAGALDGEVEVLRADSFPEYYARFNSLLARTDILWTKPSELTFYAALGIPLVLSPPVGVHERLNRRWARQRGAAFKQDKPRCAWDWLSEWLADGALAAAAWAGYMRLPKFGGQAIGEVVTRVSQGAGL